MKPSKAIEILGDSCWDYIPEDELDIRDAIKLGIEALKEIHRERRWGGTGRHPKNYRLL
ncbi:unnamed protein product [marine sediment metagenome]|uniref:Uncharacterized protein n=1 Tax=marine sediment metagenome TaxID=412755 RepID=X1PJM7_9ZZZZ